jgi:hypothetical protein
MLVLKLEIWPKDDKTKAWTVGEATLSNIGGDERAGDYEFEIEETAFGEMPARSSKGHIYHHTRALGAWQLVHRMLGSFLRRQEAKAEHARKG